MIPSLLITFREVIEAALIVATILGILKKLNQTSAMKIVWIAAIAAAALSLLLVLLASSIGITVREFYTGKTEEFFEGVCMLISSLFITWAVFFLHKYFGRYKTKLLIKLQHTVNQQEQRGLFMLTFTAVFREGFEIVLFLSTVYISTNTIEILSGFFIGATLALLICFGLVATTIRLPVFYAFRMTSILLILFAAGLLAHGAYELVEAGILQTTPHIYLPFLPEKSTVIGSIIQSIFGVTKKMDYLTVMLYSLYVTCMTWWVFIRSSKQNNQAFEERD